MPIYEFFCPETNRIYSFLARSLSYAGKTPRCPDDPKLPMEKMVSSFAVTGRAKEKTAAPGGDAALDDPRMERAMAEMERDFGGMDEENPDPRQLAAMMRKMTALTGEKMPETMNEMIRRMEAGEDPEKLEAEYGDALEDFDPGAGGGEKGEDGGEVKARRRAPATRDPVLYEMSEYVD
ncbi:MAG TPA: hypothetical protein VF614_13670 [Chthoniobacteraceae bacterium]|jgi:hypothetical protein